MTTNHACRTGEPRAPYGVARLVLLLLLVALVAGCGREATPRATRATSAPPRAADPVATPAPATADTTRQPGPDVRGLGDPNAPIQVVEYGDYQ